MYKRLTYGLFMVISCLSVLILPGCSPDADEVEVIGIEIAAESIASMMIIEDFEISMITLKILKNDGTFEGISLNSNMLSTTDIEKLSTPGTHHIQVNHLNFETTFNITLMHNHLVSSLMNIHQFAYVHDYTALSYATWIDTIIGDLSLISQLMVNELGELIIYHHDQTITNIGQVAPVKSIFVINAQLNPQGELILRYSDQTTQNLGTVSGMDGISIVSVNLNGLGELIITLSDDSIHNLGVIKDVTPMVKVTFRYDEQGYAYDIYWTKVGDQITAPSNPSRKDYVFKGWYKEGELISFPLTITDDTELQLIARWDVQLFSYTVSDGGAIITGFAVSNYTSTMTIPGEIDGYPVTKIADNAFEYRTDRPIYLSSVTFPDSLVAIGHNAFYKVEGLHEIIFGPNSKLSNIMSYAFAETDLYKPVVLPDRLLTIGNYAFNNARISQVYFSFESRLSSIGAYAFANNTHMTQFIIPSGTKTIGTNAFDQAALLTLYSYQSTSLTGWNINYNIMGRPVVWRIKHHGIENAFRYVVTDASDITILGTTDVAMEMMDIPETILGYPVRRISAYAFRGHPVRWVHLPDNLFTIGEGAFAYASSLIHVDLSLQSLLNTIGSSAFQYNVNLKYFYLSSYMTNIGVNAFLDCSMISIYTKQSSEGAFWQPGWNPGGRPIYFNQLGIGRTDDLYYVIDSTNKAVITGLRYGTSSVVIPNTIDGRVVDRIATNAFLSSDISGIAIPGNITKIDENAFIYANNATIYTTHASKPTLWHANWNPSNRPVEWNVIDMGANEDLNYIVTSSEEVTIIGAHQKHSDINIPDVISGYPVVTIATNAFRNAQWLITIDLGQSVKVIKNSAFFGAGLERIVIPKSVLSIENRAFIYNASLRQIIFDPESPVTTIEDYTFYHGLSIEEVILPNGLVTIGVSAFYNAKKVQSIFIPKTVTVIGNYAWSASTALTTVIIETGSQLYSINDYAFFACTALKTINLPEGLTYIKNSAFQQTNVIEFIIPSSVIQIQSSAFRNNPSLESIIFTENALLTQIGDTAFANLPKLEAFVIPLSVTIIGSHAFSGTTDCTIYVRATSQPIGWNSLWNSTNLPVIWGYAD
jgi:uncharacterized repeat protein (TIGR02543 family)